MKTDLYYLRIENAGRLCFDRRVFIYLFIITFALKMPEGYVLIAVYLFIYLFIYSQNSKSIEPNRMKFGGMIVYYPGTS